MMRFKSIAITALMSVLLINCRSSRNYGTQKAEKTSFHTQLITTNFNISDDNLTNPATVKYKLQMQCKGQNCLPDTGQLSFYLEPGANTVYLANRNLSITAGEKNYHWEGQSWHDIRFSPPVMGEITKVTLKLKELEKVANAQAVTGSLAENSFEWSYKNRAPIRTLLAKMDSTAEKKN